MAGEITASFDLELTNGNRRAGRPFSFTVDQTTPRYSGNIQAIGTTEEAIPLPSDITTPGYAYFINQDATNYVELGIVVSGTFQPVMKLKPGNGQMVALGTNALYARAHTAAIDLEYLILAD